MIVFTDPIIIAITFVAIVLVLIIGGIIALVNKAREEQAMSYQQHYNPAQLNVVTDVIFNVPVNNFTINNTITLMRDYSNQYAKNLIAVYTDDQPIGYIKNEMAQVIAPIMDSGISVYAKILDTITSNDKSTTGCKIQIYTL